MFSATRPDSIKKDNENELKYLIKCSGATMKERTHIKFTFPDLASPGNVSPN